MTPCPTAPSTNPCPMPSSTSSRRSSRPMPCRRTAWTSRCSTATSCAIVSGPESSSRPNGCPASGARAAAARRRAYGSTEQAQRVMALMLRHIVGMQRTLDESPTRFKPLLYLADQEARAARARRPPDEATAWCEGYMAGVKLRDDEWQPLYDGARGARLDLPDRGARVRRPAIPSSPSGSTTRRSAQRSSTSCRSPPC